MVGQFSVGRFYWEKQGILGQKTQIRKWESSSKAYQDYKRFIFNAEKEEKGKNEERKKRVTNKKVGWRKMEPSSKWNCWIFIWHSKVFSDPNENQTESCLCLPPDNLCM